MTLRARALSVRRGRREVVRDVDLEIAPGEVVAVTGPNGAGKSTLLEALSGTRRPAAGRVDLEGRPIGDWRPRDRARRLAVLPQSPALAFPFTVLEVVLMGRTPHAGRGDHPEDVAIARSALALVGLDGLAGRPCTALSGGEHQRVHLARVLAQLWTPALAGDRADRRPGYLLLDEPTASQDLRAQQHVLGCARRFAAAGGGVLCVLHDLNLAALHADRLVLLGGGRVLAAGPPARVLTPATLEAAYGLPVSVFHPPGLGRPLVAPLPGGIDRGDHGPIRFD